MAFSKSGFGLLLIMSSGTGIAAEPVPRTAAILSALTDCRTQTESAMRLACYDAAVAQLIDATEKRDVVVLDRAGIRETRKSLFGFALPRIALFGERDAKDADAVQRDDVTELQTMITAVRDLGGGKFRLTLAEGGIWQSTEGWAGGKLPVAGAKILIRRAALGSYFLKLEGGRAVRGMRVG